MERLRGALACPTGATRTALRHSSATHLLSRGGDLARARKAWAIPRFSTTQIYPAIDSERLLESMPSSHQVEGSQGEDTLR